MENKSDLEIIIFYAQIMLKHIMHVSNVKEKKVT